MSCRKLLGLPDRQPTFLDGLETEVSPASIPAAVAGLAEWLDSLRSQFWTAYWLVFVRLLFGNRARVRLRFRLFRLRLCWVQGSRRDIPFGMMLTVALYSPLCRAVEAVGGVAPQLYADSCALLQDYCSVYWFGDAAGCSFLAQVLPQGRIRQCECLQSLGFVGRCFWAVRDL